TYLLPHMCPCMWFIFFFFSNTPSTHIYTLSLHDALPILERRARVSASAPTTPSARPSVAMRAVCASTRRRTSAVVAPMARRMPRSEEHTSELQSLAYLVCRLLLEKKKQHQLSLTPDQSTH